MQVARQTVVISRLERVLAILAVIVCLIITFVFWISIGAFQPMWPLPGLYFVELVAFSFISTFIFVRGAPRGSLITWVAAGAISAFSILGVFSIGFFYLPVAFLFVVISVIADVRNNQPITAHVAIFLVAGVVQLALMFAAMGLRDSGAVF